MINRTHKYSSGIHHGLTMMYVDRYTINDDGTVAISGRRLMGIPTQFGRIEGDFICFGNKLKSLKGCPHTVEGNFVCTRNMLTTL